MSQIIHFWKIHSMMIRTLRINCFIIIENCEDINHNKTITNWDAIFNENLNSLFVDKTVLLENADFNNSMLFMKDIRTKEQRHYISHDRKIRTTTDCETNTTTLITFLENIADFKQWIKIEVTLRLSLSRDRCIRNDLQKNHTQNHVL